jgi:capsule polysaccharide export protein KpsE/RkpR
MSGGEVVPVFTTPVGLLREELMDQAAQLARVVDRMNRHGERIAALEAEMERIRDQGVSGTASSPE